MLAVSVGDYVVGVAEVANSRRVAAGTVGKGYRASDAGDVAQVPTSQALRAVVVGDADLTIRQ